MEDIRRLLSEDKIEEAIASLKTYKLSPTKKLNLDQITGLFSQLKKQKRNGIITPDQHDARRNRIRFSLLQIIHSNSEEVHVLEDKNIFVDKNNGIVAQNISIKNYYQESKEDSYEVR